MAEAYQEAKRRNSVYKTPSFTDWLGIVSPKWPWHKLYLVYIQERLDQVTTGDVKRLALFTPPRHYKSEHVTVRYAVWRIERDPRCKVIIGAYSQTLANTFCRKTRRLAESRGLLTGSDRQAQSEWETEAGGGCRGVGVGAGIVGHGGDLIILDDPIKSRLEARSTAYRERVWDWYTNDIYTRLEPGGSLVLIMTRWHKDDLAGRLLDPDNAHYDPDIGKDWEQVVLRAEAEDDDPLGRGVGESLDPERFSSTILEDRRRVLGNDYEALYQQRPSPPEGGMFKREWFEIIPSAPANITRRIRYWDKAATQCGCDDTVGLLIGLTRDGFYIIEDVVRGQWEGGRRNKIIRQVAELDGVEIRIIIEEEGGSSGKDAARADIANLAGYSVSTERPTGSKEVRAGPFAAQASVGNVKLVRGDWIAAFLNELVNFLHGVNDDQVDTASGAFNQLARNTGEVLLGFV